MREKKVKGLPVVSIVGRPNVGKSTLINRIILKREAIVDDIPGITRDTKYYETDWNGRFFTVADTGGLDMAARDEITNLIEEKVKEAIDESDAVIFLVDGLTQITPQDEEIAEILRKSGLPVILCVNKIDDSKKDHLALDFFSLGIGEPFPISAMHGLGIGELLDMLTEELPEDEEIADEETSDSRKITIAGRPNVGKSTLYNAILGWDRSIVHHTPGTTRDSIDTEITIGEESYIFVDTAGWHRSSRIREDVEFYSNLRSQRAIERSEVVIIVIDASCGVTDQDKKIAAFIESCGKACMVALNKWDIVESWDEPETAVEDALERLHFIDYAPFFSLSAARNAGIGELIDAVEDVRHSWLQRISTREFNLFVQDLTARSNMPQSKGKELKIYYTSQVGVSPPRFFFSVNDPKLFAPNFERYVKRKIRERFGFEGSPIMLKAKRRGS